MLQAESGLLSMTGHPGGAPAKIPIAALDFGSGLYAALGAVAALRERDRSGVGSHVTTSLLECAMAWLSMHVVTHRLGGDEPSPEGTRSPFFAPYEAYRTQDGHLVVVGTGGDDAWGRLCGALGLEAARADPRFADNSARVENAEALRELIESVLGGAPTAHWQAALGAAGVVCAPVQGVASALATPQVEALGIVGEQAAPTAGPIPGAWDCRSTSTGSGPSRPARHRSSMTSPPEVREAGRRRCRGRLRPAGGARPAGRRPAVRGPAGRPHAPSR